MFVRKTPIAELPRFDAFPAEPICVGTASRRLMVHVRGDLGSDRMPAVCLAGYVRNMLDFSALPSGLARGSAPVPPLVMIDLAGRGRSGPLPKNQSYSTLIDAREVIAVLDALDIGRAILCGQAHGGQVAMVIARQRPQLVGGAILIDAGPAIDPRGLVRLRTNIRHIEKLKSSDLVATDIRKMLAADYPDANAATLDRLGERLFEIRPNGRARGLFDPRLITQIEHLKFDDVLEPQWRLFDCLAHVPLLLIRSQLSDTLRRATFEEMTRRRPDARSITVEGQGSPALLDGALELDAIAAFVGSLTDARSQGGIAEPVSPVSPMPLPDGPSPAV